MASSARNVRSSRPLTERLEARIDPEQKTFFQRAAALRGVSLKEFMVASMREAAVKTIQEHEWVLSAREQEILVDVLTNPPEPNAALRTAAEDYFKLVGDKRESEFGVHRQAARERGSSGFLLRR